MEIWHGLAEVTLDEPTRNRGTVVTIGMFDGVHKGHQALIETAVAQAKERGIPSIMITFDPHPLAIIRPEAMPPQLSNLEERAEFAAKLGIDYVLALAFDRELAAQTPEQFFNTVLREELGATALVVGENFTFGARAAGNSDTLRALGAEAQVDVTVHDLVADDGTPVSSSRIRKLLSTGDVNQCDELLGRPFKVRGVVAHGAGRGGKELGFPTANLYFPDTVALPADGVYAGIFTLLGTESTGTFAPGEGYPTAVSIGHNPTFGDDRRSVEAFVLDHDGDLYDREVEVEFIQFLRPMEKFAGIEALMEAIRGDIAGTREALNRYLTQNH